MEANLKNMDVEKLVTECKRIEEDSLYTQVIHHVIARYQIGQAFWLKLIPAVLSVLSVGALLIGFPDWVAWITLVFGFATLVSIFVEPEKEAKLHIFAAKNFTALKHEARVLHEAFRFYVEKKEFYHEVKELREKYNFLVQFTPSTENPRAWAEARKRIKAGTYEPDYKSKKQE